MENGQSLKCTECGKIFKLYDFNIKKSPIILDNTSYILKYFRCPNCTAIFQIGLEDEWLTNELSSLRTMREQMLEMSRNEDISGLKAMQQTLAVHTKSVARYSKQLHNKYPGKFYFDYDGVLVYEHK